MQIHFLLICFNFTFFPFLFASKSPNATESEIINLTMQQSAQGIPDAKLGEEQPSADGNGGVEPIRLVNLPFKGREKVIGGAQRDKLLEKLGRLEPLSKVAAGSSGAAPLLRRARQLRDPLGEDGVSNSLPSAGLSRLLSASNSNRLTPSTNSFGFGANSPLSLTQLAAILRQSRNPSAGNDQQNPSNLAAIQSIQREQQRLLQQQQQLALQIAIQQRAQRLQQQQLQQQLLASQNKGNEGRTIDLPNNNNIFPGRFGRNSLPNVQIQRPSSAGNINPLNGLANLNGQSSLIPTRLASDGQQDISSLLQSIRPSNSLASLLNGQTNSLVDPSNIISPSNIQPNSLKIVADEQQKALQQILEQEQRILDLLNNKRDLQNVQEQQQRILALLNQQQGQQGELAKTLVATNGGLLNGGGINSAGANAQIGLQPNLLARILNVGQPTSSAPTFVPAPSSTDIQQQPIFISSSSPQPQQLLGNNLDLSQLIQQQIVPSTNGQQQSSQLLQILQGGQQPTIFGGGIPLQSQSTSLDGSNGGIPFTQPNLANLLLENDGQFPTSSLALNDANSNPNSDNSGLLLFQRGQPKTGIQPENEGQKREEKEEEEEEDEKDEQKEENIEEEEEKETN